MKRTLELVHKYLPYLPPCYILIMWLYMLIAAIYMMQIHQRYDTMSANEFEKTFGCGIAELRTLDFGLLIISFLALIVWVIASIIGYIIYHRDFEWKLRSFILIVIFLCCYLTGSTWFYG